MAVGASKRPAAARTLPLLLVGGSALLLVRSALPAFLAGTHGVSSRPQVRGSRVVARGFKEDFDAWRSGLTPEEQDLVRRQAAGEFDKKFRKSDDFKKDLSDEKVQAFSQILGKFLDSEIEDQTAFSEAKRPDYNLFEKAGDKEYSFAMQSRVEEIDRDAERRFRSSILRNKKLQAEGKGGMPLASPRMEHWALPNDTPEGHDMLVHIQKLCKEGAAKASGEGKKTLEEIGKMEIPPVGELVTAYVPMQWMDQMVWAHDTLQLAIDEQKESWSEDEYKTFMEEKKPQIIMGVAEKIYDTWQEASAVLEEDVKNMKEWFKGAKTAVGKSKAEVLKSTFKVLSEAYGKKLEVDPELLKELEGEKVEPGLAAAWGYADKLYKSVAIDSFGEQYLIGIYETQAEAKKAFDEWNAEYEKARASMEGEVAEWNKQQTAQLEKDEDGGRARIMKILEETRAKYS